MKKIYNIAGEALGYLLVTAMCGLITIVCALMGAVATGAKYAIAFETLRSLFR